MGEERSLAQRLIESKKLIVIAGPTASGKTALSLSLADALDIEIVSADSRQIYKYLDIGTAKPDKEELSKVRHHFIDLLNPDEDFSAGKFGLSATAVVNEIFNRGKIPVVVGGSGLYIKALCEGLFNAQDEEADTDFRSQLIDRLSEKGIDDLYNELKSVDPDSFSLYADKNPRRILRALEYYYSTGRPISVDRESFRGDAEFKPVYFALYFERPILYKRIEERTEKMWADGLLAETQHVISMGYSPDLNSLNTVGYKECIDLINGRIDTSSAIDKIKQNTRRYAKRQMTWFNRVKNIHWLIRPEKAKDEVFFHLNNSF